MDRIRCIVLSKGRITGQENFLYFNNAIDWACKTFPKMQPLRYNDHECVFKSGNLPVNIIIAKKN